MVKDETYIHQKKGSRFLKTAELDEGGLKVYIRFSYLTLFGTGYVGSKIVRGGEILPPRRKTGFHLRWGDETYLDYKVP